MEFFADLRPRRYLLFQTSSRVFSQLGLLRKSAGSKPLRDTVSQPSLGSRPLPSSTFTGAGALPAGARRAQLNNIDR